MELKSQACEYVCDQQLVSVWRIRTAKGISNYWNLIQVKCYLKLKQVEVTIKDKSGFHWYHDRTRTQTSGQTARQPVKKSLYNSSRRLIPHTGRYGAHLLPDRRVTYVTAIVSPAKTYVVKLMSPINCQYSWSQQSQSQQCLDTHSGRLRAEWSSY